MHRSFCTIMSDHARENLGRIHRDQLRAVCCHHFGKFEGDFCDDLSTNLQCFKFFLLQGMQNATRAGSQLFHQENISKRRSSVIDLSDLKPSFSPIISDATTRIDRARRASIISMGEEADKYNNYGRRASVINDVIALADPHDERNGTFIKRASLSPA